MRGGQLTHHLRAPRGADGGKPQVRSEKMLFAYALTITSWVLNQPGSPRKQMAHPDWEL